MSFTEPKGKKKTKKKADRVKMSGKSQTFKEWKKKGSNNVPNKKCQESLTCSWKEYLTCLFYFFKSQYFTNILK